MQLDILMVTYKRPKVLDYTLKCLINQISADKGASFDSVRFFIAANEYTQEDATIINEYVDTILPSIGVEETGVIYYAENKGKAFALNDMYDTFGCEYSDFVLTMDQDMVFLEPFLHHIKKATTMNFEIVGFASTSYWGHIPQKKNCVMLPWGDYNIYYIMFITGGLMLFHANYLKENKWTNEDGVYGGDDYNMCFTADSKFILEYNTDWVQHDPLGRNMKELERYYAIKDSYTDAGIYVLPHGWYDENIDL